MERLVGGDRANSFILGDRPPGYSVVVNGGPRSTAEGVRKLASVRPLLAADVDALLADTERRSAQGAGSGKLALELSRDGGRPISLSDALGPRLRAARARLASTRRGPERTPAFLWLGARKVFRSRTPPSGRRLAELGATQLAHTGTSGRERRLNVWLDSAFARGMPRPTVVIEDDLTLGPTAEMVNEVHRLLQRGVKVVLVCRRRARTGELFAACLPLVSMVALPWAAPPEALLWGGSGTAAGVLAAILIPPCSGLLGVIAVRTVPHRNFLLTAVDESRLTRAIIVFTLSTVVSLAACAWYLMLSGWLAFSGVAVALVSFVSLGLALGRYRAGSRKDSRVTLARTLGFAGLMLAVAAVAHHGEHPSLRFFAPAGKPTDARVLDPCDLRHLHATSGRALDLTDLDLRGCNLSNADLTNVILEGTDFSDAILLDAKITQTELDRAFGNEKTKLPTGLRIPCGCPMIGGPDTRVRSPYVEPGKSCEALCNE